MMVTDPRPSWTPCHHRLSSPALKVSAVRSCVRQERLAQNDKLRMDREQQSTGVRASIRHLHVWTWFTLRRMLDLAQPRFAELGVPFSVHTQYVTKKRERDSMKEFRVALIRGGEARVRSAQRERSVVSKQRRESSHLF